MPLELDEKPRDVKAWNRFLEIGLPSKEPFQYVRLNTLYSTRFTIPKPFLPDIALQQDTLFFVNGVFCPTLSQLPPPLIALPLEEALKTYGGFLNPRIQKQLKEERDPFAALNGAYVAGGAFIYIPPHFKAERAIRVVHWVQPDLRGAILLTPRIHIFAGRSSSVPLCYSQEVAAGTVWINSYFDYALEEGAHITFSHLSENRGDVHHFLALRATLKKNASFKSVSITDGGIASREDYLVTLQGEGAEAALYGVWSLKERREHHVNVWMDHREAHGTSLQKFKGIVRDETRSSFEGKIYVAQKAQKTQAYQMNNNLVLGDRASAYTKPNLEIFADDVKASHGATVGQLDPEQLFYLTTRGISMSQATDLLLQGFTEEIVEQIMDADSKRRGAKILL